MKKNLILVIPFLLYSFFASGKETSAILSEANFIITGTSTMKNWEMVCKNAVGKAEFIFHENRMSEITSLHVYVKAAAITGDNESMDEKAHRSLKVNEHPLIRYNLRSVTELNQAGENISLISNGIISVAGETRKSSFPVNGTVKNGGILFTGQTSFSFKEFNIESPVFMRGLVKTGDIVKVNFAVFFKYN